MAGTVNKVVLIGRLGKDPEVKSVAGGTTLTSFSLATDETWTDGRGEKQSRTDWHNIVAWGKLGEICGQYLSKGKLVYIEGSIRYEQWEDKESGQKRTATKIVAAKMTMLDKKDDGGSQQRPAAASASRDRWDEDEDEVPF